ncbi:hypothetical protein HNY73_009246 [Argiope bruennichi]|uniref:Uncharacterized protein n=1 Tax=Argiope bruennichi TaxID=94029 RepID=A0A8T0F9W5_ARGBR|nr:hypothetical protein HNY73_009246 [Argiope bruennichi]
MRNKIERPLTIGPSPFPPTSPRSCFFCNVPRCLGGPTCKDFGSVFATTVAGEAALKNLLTFVDFLMASVQVL